MLSAVECFNLIPDHLLIFKYVDHACKVLLNNLNQPKQFTFCRYPLLLACLVCEFMNKLIQRFPVYDSFFRKIHKSYLKIGTLFVSRVRNHDALKFHLNKRDLKNRTTKQIMSFNRLYHILNVDDVGMEISADWNGLDTVFGFNELSSFTYLSRYDLVNEATSLTDFSPKYNENRLFYFNYYCYRDICAIRYVFKEILAYVLVVIFQILLYRSVKDKKLDNTFNGEYSLLTWISFIFSTFFFLNKLNSLTFFTFVNRWFIEVDSLLLEIAFGVSIFVHYLDVKSYFLQEDQKDLKELVNACLLSLQVSYMWFRVILSLRVTKLYGGFLRTIFVMLKKMSMFMAIFFGVIMMFTGIYATVFNNNWQFQDYWHSFFTLFSVALTAFDLKGGNLIDFTWHPKVTTYFVVFFSIVMFLFFVNLLIALATNAYEDVNENLESEHRANLVKLHEYLKFDHKYGIFKFLFAPFSVLNIPLGIILLFSKDKIFWNDKFCKWLFFSLLLVFFFLFSIFNLVKLPFTYVKMVIIVPFRSTKGFVKRLEFLVLGPLILVYYYILDLVSFWKHTYSPCFTAEKSDKVVEIRELQSIFSSLIYDMSKVIEKNKLTKKFHVVDLVQEWLDNVGNKTEIVFENEKNRSHKRFLLRTIVQSKEKTISDSNFLSKIQTRLVLSRLFSETKQKISVSEYFNKLVVFLQKFCDRDGTIDKEIARRLFPRQNYYNEEYFSYLYYFNFDYFSKIIAKFSYKAKSQSKEIHNFESILTEIKRSADKFGLVKPGLKEISLDSNKNLIETFNFINYMFAVRENSLAEELNKEILNKIAKNKPDNSIFNVGSMKRSKLVKN